MIGSATEVRFPLDKFGNGCYTVMEKSSEKEKRKKMNALKKFFTNDTVFALAMFFSVMFSLASALLKESTSDGLMFLLTAACCYFLYFSYKKHDKNLMKGLLGAELTILCMTAIRYMDVVEGIADTVFTFVIIGLYLALTFNHFVLNSSRFSNPTSVLLNQILSVAVLLVSIVWNLLQVRGDVENVIYFLMGALNSFCQIYLIVYVESKLDAFREKREAGGWTEENGYPADYKK